MEEREGQAAGGRADELVQTLGAVAARLMDLADAGPPPVPEPLMQRLERERRSRRRSKVIVLAVFLVMGLTLLWVAISDFLGSLPRVASTPGGGISVGVEGFPCAGGFPLLFLAALGAMLYLWLGPRNSGKALAALQALPAGRESLPVTAEAVEEMSLAFGLRRRPDLYVIESQALNAFVVGRALDTAAVAVTRGLSTAMALPEQRAVVAHLFARLLIGRAAASEEDGQFEEQADALAMQTLRDPEALLHALEQVRGVETMVPVTGWLTDGFFFVPPMPLAAVREHMCDRRLARLRAVLGAEGSVS